MLDFESSTQDLSTNDTLIKSFQVSLYRINRKKFSFDLSSFLEIIF